MKLCFEDPDAPIADRASSTEKGHGRITRRTCRTSQVLHGYSDFAGLGQAVEEKEPFDADQRAAECMFTGLRRADGVSLEAVETRYGISVIERYGKDLSTFIDLGLVQVSNGYMRLTEDGFMISNEIFQVFL